MTECCVEHVRDLSHHGGDGEKNKRNYGLARVPDNMAHSREHNSHKRIYLIAVFFIQTI